MTADRFETRVMSRCELDQVVGWARDEGWNPGLHDATPFHATDPEGFLVGVLDGEPIASISVVRYGPSFGFLGIYIVAPSHRGKGYGLRLWQAGMARLDGRLVGLDGVPDQQANYERSGFRTAYRTARYGGPAPAAEPASRAAGSAGFELVDARSVPFDRLAAFDAGRFPGPRGAFLSAWLALPESRALVAVQDGGIVGFGVRRRAVEGHRIGPLFADARPIAEALFAALAAEVPGAPVFADVPQSNEGAGSMFENLGFTPAFEAARIYTGAPPLLDATRIYAVTTLELG